MKITTLPIEFSERLPNIDTMASKVEAVFGGVLVSCEHMPTANIGSVCVQHLEVGVLCQDCWAIHLTLTHTDALEFECDGCGTDCRPGDIEIHPLAIVREAECADNGHVHRIVINGLGLCDWCSVLATTALDA